MTVRGGRGMDAVPRADVDVHRRAEVAAELVHGPLRMDGQGARKAPPPIPQ